MHSLDIISDGPIIYYNVYTNSLQVKGDEDGAHMTVLILSNDQS